jgi:hypothetical protein
MASAIFGKTHAADRSPTIGLAYTGDAVMNANLDRIDAAFAEVAAHIVELSTPEEPVVEDPPADEETHRKSSRK